MQALGLPMVLLETRHAHGVLKAQRNKADKNDARGLAQIVRTGWYKAVHVKGEPSHRLKCLLASRRLLKRKLTDLENQVRQSLKAFGIKLGARAQRSTFPERVRAAVAHDPVLAAVSEPLLRAWSVLLTEHNQLLGLLMKVVGQDELCRRFMAIPGVGPVTVSFDALRIFLPSQRGSSIHVDDSSLRGLGVPR